MHASSLENMQKCYDRYIAPRLAETSTAFNVLDVGGADVNGSYAEIFAGPNFNYTAADLTPGPGVSIVLDDPYRLPFQTGSLDIVLSGQMLEHCEFFWESFEEMIRVLRPDGYLFLIAPSSGPIHQYPVDCYRFYPDAYRALAKRSECHLIDVWHDQRGPWNDLVGVFSKRYEAPKRNLSPSLSDVAKINQFSMPLNPELDIIRGARPYLDVLQHIHDQLMPKTYLEIGVRKGKSISLAKCESVGVDPDPDVEHSLGGSTRIVRQSSDDFFEIGDDPILSEKLDLSFIDGMHLFENALRDFMHVEARSHAATVIAIDDVSPNHPIQAARKRSTRVWTGDVWKLHDCLRQFRPDLRLLLLDTEPTGLLLVTGLDPQNRVLWEKYNPIVRKYRDMDSIPPDWVMERHEAKSPENDSVDQFLKVASPEN